MDKLHNLNVTEKYIGMVQEVDELRYAFPLVPLR